MESIRERGDKNGNGEMLNLNKTISIFDGWKHGPEFNTRGLWRRQWKDARNVLVRTTLTLFRPPDTPELNPAHTQRENEHERKKMKKNDICTLIRYYTPLERYEYNRND